MSEKTPLQLGREAAALYEEHKRVESLLEDRNTLVSSLRLQAKLLSDVAVGQYVSSPYAGASEDDPYASMSAEAAQEKQQNLLKRLTVMENFKSAVLVDSGVNSIEAGEHYLQNADLYYELGVLEAGLDGVKINPDESKYQIGEADTK